MLGPIEVRRDGALIDLGGRQRRLLLAMLVAASGAATSVDVLTDALWNEAPPASAMTVLHAQLSRLRTALEPDRGPRRRGSVLQSVAGGYRLVLDGHRLDTATFSDLVAQAQAVAARSDFGAAKKLYVDAMALWNGPVFGDLGDLPALVSAARGFEEKRLVALGDMAEVRLRLGEHESLVSELEALVREHAFHERFWGQLMLALYRSGRQADALGAFQRCRKLLISELGIEPGPALQSLDEAVLLHKSELDWAPDGLPTPSLSISHHPPPRMRTRFVGRESELVELTDRLVTRRLLTITGPGGVGKTRLAVEAAMLVADRFPHGVAYCDLVGLPAGIPVESAVVEAVGATSPAGRDTSPLEHLRTRHHLLVIDNAEHVAAEAATLVDDLLEGCPRLTVLVTSREPLGVRGESLMRLAPLDASGPDGAAVELFLDRSSRSDLRVDVVRDVCRRLDGLPLAIELAASLSASTPLDVLLEGFDERPNMLAGAQLPRGTPHRTLRDLLARSIETLSADEAALLRRLAVFANGFSTAAAAAVCEISGPPALAIASLVQRSLVQLHTDGTSSRYRLLETIRADGLARLAEHGELDHFRSRHLAWCRTLAPVTVEAGHGEDPASLADLTPEIDNVVAALDWGLSGGDGQAGIELAVITAPWWVHAGRFAEGLHWLERAAVVAPDAVTEARVQASQGWLLARQGNLGAARTVLAEALSHVPPDEMDTYNQIALQLAFTEIDAGDLERGAVRLASVPEGHGLAQIRDATLRELAYGRRAMVAGEQHEAADHLERCADLARTARMWLTLARALSGLAQVEANRMNHQRAQGAISEALVISRRHGLLGILPRILGAAAYVAHRAGDDTLAQTQYEEALSAAHRADDPAAEATTFANLGALALHTGEPVKAVEKLEQAVEIFRRIGDRRGTMQATASLAEAAISAHADVRRSLRLCLEVVDQAGRLNVPWLTVIAIETAACALTMRRADGDLGRAARFIGAAQTARLEFGRPAHATEDGLLRQAITEIEQNLGADALRTEQAVGRTRGLAEIVAEFIATCSP